MKCIILVSIISVLFVACIKEECKINGGQYEFEIPVTLYPANDTFNIGDTIAIKSSFSDEVFERMTDRHYKLENFRFFPGTEIQRIDVHPAIESLDDFEVIINPSIEYEVRTFSSGEKRLKGEYRYSSESYYLEFFLIPNKIGMYYIEQSVAPDISPHQDFEGKCSNLEVGGAVVLNGGADNNIHMLSDSPDPHFNDWILQKPHERFHKFGGYCFYVKE